MATLGLQDLTESELALISLVLNLNIACASCESMLDICQMAR
jgi:hypothetical protein